MNSEGKSVDYPWIRIADHKNGTPSSNVIRANNLAMQLSRSDKTINFQSNKNSVILSPAKVFMDITKFDYRLKSTSKFIDSGDATFAPSTDIRNYRRPAGAGPDRGAYEMNSTPATATQDLSSSTTSLLPPPRPPANGSPRPDPAKAGPDTGPAFDLSELTQK